MKSVILGTAGHVDHGKTALVEALTGVNTDRWAEERERGITIDLGFASLPSGVEDLEISVVDVPGHEDFVKNMLAGASGVDLLLAVVAADEGPMPQTLEHLWIARLLGVDRGVVVISKSDLVDDEWRELVTESVREELRNVFGDVDWPVLSASAVTGEGISELKEAIETAARATRARRDEDLFRLPIDRSFSVRGVGTVVTGTVWSGNISAGEEVRIMPGDRKARVRGVQVHDEDVNTARAGQRAAVALVGVDRSDVGRGHTLVADSVWRETRYLDAHLRLLPDSPWPLRHWQRIRLHLGTSEAMARVALFDAERLQPGDGALVQLRLESPVVARTGDRFVVRFYSPVTTIGGGVIIDPWARRRNRLTADETRALNELAGGDGRSRVISAVEGALNGVTEAQLALLTGTPPSLLVKDLSTLADDGVLRAVEGRWFSVETMRATRNAILELIASTHARDAGAKGIGLEALRSTLGDASLVNAALGELEADGHIRIDGAVAALKDHVPRLDAGQEELAARASADIAAAGLMPPRLKELAANLGVSEDAILPILKFLADAGGLVPVTPDLYLDAGAIKEAKKRVERVLVEHPEAPPSELRDALGVSRKYLIPLLEHLDAVGFTRRTAKGRVLRQGS